MSIIQRSVLPADLPAVRTALIETWHATYDGLYGRAQVDDITARWHSLAALSAQRDDCRSVFLLTANDHSVLGSSYAREVEPGIVHLYRLYIHPSAQRAGLGSQLMQATFAAFPSATLHRLDVDPQNLSAIAFYQRAGFSIVGAAADGGADSGVAALVLERTVARYLHGSAVPNEAGCDDER